MLHPHPRSLSKIFKLFKHLMQVQFYLIIFFSNSEKLKMILTFKFKQNPQSDFVGFSQKFELTRCSHAKKNCYFKILTDLRYPRQKKKKKKIKFVELSFVPVRNIFVVFNKNSNFKDNPQNGGRENLSEC